jgi:preprotein translocase subunit SecF
VTAVEPTPKKSFRKRLLSFDNDIDFRKGWRIAIGISLAVMLLSAISLLTRGLELGIDFKGGVAYDVPKTAPTATVRDALRPFGEADAKIQVIGNKNLRVETGRSSVATQLKVRDALATVTKAAPSSISRSDVGASWGSEVSDKALRALIFFLIAIAIYISVRLEWRMAVGALVAVLHDIFISVGVYSIFQFEVTPGTVIAFLTILGFSLYDTIVVYDKVADNTRRLTASGKLTYGEMMNLSLNQVIMRSLNTTLTALLPVISILVIGAYALWAVALEEFGLALLVGLFVGAYSSVFVASPIVAFLKEREPRYRQLRQKLEERRARDGIASPLGARAALMPDLATAGTGSSKGGAKAAGRSSKGATKSTAGKGSSGAGSSTTTATPDDDVEDTAKPEPRTAPSSGLYSANHPPRPRKKGKRR